MQLPLCRACRPTRLLFARAFIILIYIIFSFILISANGNGESEDTDKATFTFTPKPKPLPGVEDEAPAESGDHAQASEGDE